MIDFESKHSYDVYDLSRIIALLRAPGGCPWDIEQTHESIRRNLLEEAYEAAEAIDEDDAGHLREELGDVLMQVVFHCDIEEKSGRFNLDDTADEACRKLIRRHPHVFGDVSAATSGEVRYNWDIIKKEEKNHTTVAESMSSVARSLPALWRAEKIQGKAAKAGVDVAAWAGVPAFNRRARAEKETGENFSGTAKEALERELGALETSISTGTDIEEHLGDLLFSVVNLSRSYDIDPENALSLASERFIAWYARLEGETAGEQN